MPADPRSPDPSGTGPVRLRRRPRRRPLAVGAGAVVAALVAVAVNPGRAAGTPVAVARHDLVAGTVVGPADLRVERMRVPDRLAGQVLTPARVRRARGRTLTVSLRADDVVTTAMLGRSAAPGAPRAVSVPVPRSRAVNGRIARGDRVDVVVVVDGVASVGVADVEVLAVDEVGGGFAAVDRDLTVTLAVDAEQGVRLAAAVAGGQFLLARVGRTVGR